MNGMWQAKDVDNDGIVDMYADRTAIGQSLPSHWIGWNNFLRYNRLSLAFLWQGTFGHSLANISALHFRIDNNVNWNTIKSDQPLAPGNVWNSEFAEKASYVRLQYISLDYLFPLNITGPIRQLHVYLAGNNLVTFSGYTGNDPEVRLTDPGDPLAGGRAMFTYQQTPFYTPGIDRPATWLPSRSFVVGAKVSF